MDVEISVSTGLKGTVEIPGDKSISHRAVMLGSLAKGITEISNFLPGEDCLSTVECFRTLGITIEETGGKTLRVHGQGLHGLKEPKNILNVGNSGTTIRLMLGILAGQGFFSVLTGDETIRRRPMGRVSIPLREMGASIFGRQNGERAPLAILGGGLKPTKYKSPVASAQVKSAILLAGLYTDGVTTVQEPYLSRDHTERMLKAFGAKVETLGSTVMVEGQPVLTSQIVNIPGDISSAAFLLVAGAIVKNSRLRLLNVGINPTRDGILEILKAMGANLAVENVREVSGEPVGDLVISTSELKGVKIGGGIIPRLIDEVPILAVAAAYADGVTEIRDAAELKVKETNRIAAVARELGRMGAIIEELPDGLRIVGGKLKGAEIETHGDHRMAMAMAVAALGAEGNSIIKKAEVANVSFPDFFTILDNLRA